MPFRLVSADTTQSVELRQGAALVLGRAPTSDIPVIDPTISRRHAELEATEQGVSVRDLGSSNGTFVNGARIEQASLEVGDVVAFGKVKFRLQAAAARAPSASPTPASPTIVRSVVGREQTEVIAEKLAILLEVSKGLGRTADIDALLDKITSYAYQILDVGRVAIQLVDEAGELVSKSARDRQGGETMRAVPTSIARTALADKVAILSDNAGEDARFGGPSILTQQVRSAICVPLIGVEERPLGVLYVDHVLASHRFTEDDLDFCIAFAGIAAVAIENSQFAQRIQRELVTRSNFERFFTPQLARRISQSAESVRLGGEKRPVAVLFSDIRGFAALAETMRPDDMASLLTEYFTAMVDCVFRHDGTLDKFIGDAVMAQWGAPLGGPNDVEKAVAAAMDMMHALEELNRSWREQGRPELQIGIGLNYGEAFAGNIGSERRLEFTVIGDTVNIAKRLCDAAEPGEILISDQVRCALNDPPRLAPCPAMQLKNKSQAVTVYRVLLD